MQKNIELKLIKSLLVSFILMMPAFVSAQQAVKLVGYDQIITDINQQNRHALKKLNGKTYHLRVTGNDAASYELSLFPEDLFEVKNQGHNSFEVTVIEPLSLWKKHKQEAFQIKWVLDEVVDY